MIAVTRPDGSTLLLNPDRIESIEETPDTVITLTDGRKLLVREGADVVAARFTAYRRSLRAGPRRAARTPPADPIRLATAPIDEEAVR
jgi:flagellar protein FlbD